MYWHKGLLFGSELQVMQQWHGQLSWQPWHGVTSSLHHTSWGKKQFACTARQSPIPMPECSTRRQHQLLLPWEYALMCTLRQRRAWASPSWRRCAAPLAEPSSCTLHWRRLPFHRYLYAICPLPGYPTCWSSAYVVVHCCLVAKHDWKCT